MIPYRDGFSAAYQRFEERRQQLGGVHVELTGLPRSRLGSHADLARAVAAAAPRDLDECQAADQLLDAFEHSLRDLGNLACQLRAARLRREPLRGDVRAIAASFVLVGVMALVIADGGPTTAFAAPRGGPPKNGAAPSATPPDPCADDLQCLWAGRCTFDSAGHCLAASDRDCRASYDCERRGRCTSDGWQCIAMRDADCGASLFCMRADECRAVNGACAR